MGGKDSKPEPSRVSQMGYYAAVSFHPHLHCVVTGGGLSLDGQRWVAGQRRYFLPVKVLGKLFRGKFLAALKTMYQARQLTLTGSVAHLNDPRAFQQLLDALYGRPWAVYAKRAHQDIGQARGLPAFLKRGQACGISYPGSPQVYGLFPFACGHSGKASIAAQGRARVRYCCVWRPFDAVL
jgi:hypothetical protein